MTLHDILRPKVPHQYSELAEYFNYRFGSPDRNERFTYVATPTGIDEHISGQFSTHMDNEAIESWLDDAQYNRWHTERHDLQRWATRRSTRR